MTDPTHTESRILFQRAGQADDEAQTQLYDRYAKRLLGLVRSRFNGALQARFDADDVVNSAFRSFFVSLEKGRFQIPQQGGLWPLLAQITLHKLHRSSQHHARLRRATSAEQRPASEFEPACSHDALAELSLNDELAALAQKLPDGAATALELSISGYDQAEIAGKLGCTTRTVRRYLAEARVLLRARLCQLSHPDHIVSSLDDTKPLAADSYLLRRMIGAGVFGKVYLATEKATGADVAVKYLRKRWTNDSAVVRRFIKESALLQQMKIDGVVPCFGGGATKEGGRFFVMKWIDGQTLFDRNAATTRDEANVRRDFAAIARTLADVHAKGITHCDLKPTNVLIDNAERLWITDFGFARTESSLLTQLAGTPAYMAPEQFDPFFGPIGPWTDLYAVGKMMLESVTGQCPNVQQSDLPATADRLLHSADAPLSSGMRIILGKLLQRSVAKRLASAHQLAEMLTGNG